MQEMTEDEVQSIWRLAPYIFGERDNSFPRSSSFGGRQRPAGMGSVYPSNPRQIRTLEGEPKSKRLYTSLDDYTLAATLAEARGSQANDDSDADGMTVDADSPKTLIAERVRQGRFFLTTRGAAPELTLRGTPKLCLWPMWGGPDGVEGAVKNGRPPARPSPSSCYSLYDVLMADRSHLRSGSQIRPYYFQRRDVGSRHTEFYQFFDGRNHTLWRYLANQLVEPIPGFKAAADARLGTFPSFGGKYGAGEFDDVSAIATLMVDGIRNQNTADGNIHPPNWYLSSQFWGQVTPICLCGGTNQHGATWPFATRPTPKGMGRFLTITEVALAIGLRNKVMAGVDRIPEGAFHGNNQRAAEALGSSFDHYEIEVAVLLEGFAPAQGWSEYRPGAGFTLGGFHGPAKLGERTPNANPTDTALDLSIGTMQLSGQPLVFPAGGERRSTTVTEVRSVSDQWIGWGGTLGCRFTNRLIAFKPILWSIKPGQEPPAFRFSGSPNDPSLNHLRLIVYDIQEIPDASTSPAVGNMIQSIPLAFPAIERAPFVLPFGDPNPIPFTDPPATGGAAGGQGTRIARSRDANGELYGAHGLIHPDFDIVQSLVPNHGDFRLLAAKRSVMQGHVRDGGNNAAREYPTFVAHPNYGHPDDRAHDYKLAEVQGGPNGVFPIADQDGPPAHWRHFIDADQTLRQWEDRFHNVYPPDTSATWTPGAFISPTEICDQWLVPEGCTLEEMHSFWMRHRLTGDNTKERPYVNLYPRLTTRSNTYRVHVVAQSLRVQRRNDPNAFSSADGDQIIGDYRGSFLIERMIDATDPDLPDFAEIFRDNPSADFTSMDHYYRYQISREE